MFADARFAASHARQFPDAGAGGIEIAIDVGVDHAGFIAGNALTYGLVQIGRTINAHTVNTGRALP